MRGFVGSFFVGLPGHLDLLVILKYMGWSLADIGNLGINDLRFWWKAIADLIKQEQEQLKKAKK